MSTDPSNRANNWAAQRKQAIEKAKQTREERKFNLAKAGEMSVANEIGSTHLNRVTSSDNQREYPKAPTNDFPLNSRKPATMKYGMSLLDQQPTEEELIQARTSLRLLKSKMKDSNGFPPMARTADQYMDHNQGERRQVGQGYQYNSSNNEGDNNGNYRKVFKPSFKDDDYNKMNSNLNRDLTQIDKTLSQKSRPSIGGGGGYSNYQSQQNYDPPQYSRPRDNGTKPPIGGNNRNNMYDANQNEDFQDFSSKNIPSRLPKNTTTMSAQKPKQTSLYDDNDYSAQVNNKPKYGGYGGNRGYMEEENPIPRKDYQGYEYKPQQRVQENPLAKNNFESNNFGNKPNNMNKGWPSNANSNSNSYGNNAYNNRQQAFDDRESDNTAVFSKPNLKKAQPSANNPAPYNRQNDDFDNRPLKGGSNNNNPYSRQPQNNDDFDSRPPKGASNNNQYNRQPQNNNDDDLDNRPLKGSNNNMPSEYAPRNEGPQIECPHGCGRSFNAEALDKHAKICQKVFQSKRKKFDSAAQREGDDQGETGYDNNRYNPPKNYKAPAGKSGAAGGKSAKWKQQSEAFRANLKAARGEKLSQEEEVKLAKASTDHLVPCPSCGRKFNENAAARHIPFCESKQKVDNIKKGGKGKR